MCHYVQEMCTELKTKNRHSLIIFNLRTRQDFALVISERESYSKSFFRFCGFYYNSTPSSHSITWLIVSITKFSIVIGPPRAYLSRNRCAITWVSNYRCLIWTFCNWIPVIGYPRDLHVSYARFNGFFCNVLHSFQRSWKALQMFSLKRTSQKTFFNSKICYRYD